MSLTPGVTGIGPAPAGISSVVSQDDLTRFAQIAGVVKYLTAPLDEAPAPTAPSTVAGKMATATFQNLYAQLRAMGVPVALAWLWASFWGSAFTVLAPLAAFVGQLFGLAAAPIGVAVMSAIGELRAGVDPAVGAIAVEVLNEFLGTDFTQGNLPMGMGTSDHLGRARAIGSLLYNQLESEFAPAGGGAVVPNFIPAATFSGLAVNFGLASGIIGVIGGLFPDLELGELRELGEEVARNIGLGRLVRRALTPLVTTLVSNPAQWAINTKYLPTQFKENELVNPFAQTLLPTDKLYAAMHLLGYSDDKIAAFISMHQKRLTPSDIALLVNNALWSGPDAQKYLAAGGWPEGMQGTLFALEDLREQQKWYDKLVAELEEEVKTGRMTVDEFVNVLNGTAVSSTLGTPGAGGISLPARQGLPYSDSVKQVIIATVKYKASAGVKLRPHLLSQGELYQAFGEGLLTAAELRDRWNNLGLPQADQDTRLQLWLLRLNRLHELETERQKQYTLKVQAFGEKQAGTKPGPLPPVPPVPPFPIG